MRDQELNTATDEELGQAIRRMLHSVPPGEVASLLFDGDDLPTPAELIKEVDHIIDHLNEHMRIAHPDEIPPTH